VVFSSCLLALLSYLAVERLSLDRALRRVPRRVAVTGTRGKSSVTRLVAAGLRGAGLRVLAKTTGSKPILIHPDGSETEIVRAGPPSVREQVGLVRLAARRGVDVLVSEMMSIGPECLAVESRRILRPGTLALTNVKLDHLEAMGRRKDDIARALTSAIPERADVYVPEEEVYPVFSATAARSGATLHPVPPLPEGGGLGAGPALPFGEHEVNVRLALAVLASLGVDRDAARRGLSSASPDLGTLRLWRGRFGDPPRPAVCVNAFAANEPESSAAALEMAGRKVPLAARTVVAVLSLREDRGDRTLQWARAAADGFFRGFAHVVLAGPPAAAALRKFRKAAGPGRTGVSRFAGSSPAALMDHVLSLAPGEPVVVGLGNIVGLGEEVVRYWEERGEPDDR
jgi:poly-gamma-glutamate synthase PgsB/CapB